MGTLKIYPFQYIPGIRTPSAGDAQASSSGGLEMGFKLQARFVVGWHFF
jgi:hypothetical protein